MWCSPLPVGHVLVKLHCIIHSITPSKRCYDSELLSEIEISEV